MYRLTVAGRYTVQFEMIRLDDITCLAVARVTIPWTVLPSSTFKKKKNESRNPITVKRILWRDRPLRYHSTILLISGLLSLGLLSGHASAQSVRDTSDNGQEQAVQDSFATADSFARRHVVQLSPHVLLFNPQTQSATLEFHNPTDSVERAQVQVQFALLDYRPRGLPGDSIIIDPNGPSMPHDTVIAHPGPTDHFAGRWLSGVPTTITLAPHATKRVTLRLTPPPKLPAGEYWARIQTIIPISPRRGGAQDMRQRYALPTPVRVPLLRDTCLVLYRQGPLHMGLAIGSGAIARLDSADIGGVNNEYVWKHALWIRLPLHLTGNVPFRGMMHSQFRNLHDGEELNRNQQELLLMRDVVLHIEVETYKLGPGQYEYDIWFDNERTDLSPTERLSMPPVRKAFRFEVLPAWAY
ncbi:MAG TPA: hypothetical protein VNU46_06405 [Gemmatimonadaceae bacterium]|nr:hypothetical protein [Gemmatimonadaceae bacterium]